MERGGRRFRLLAVSVCCWVALALAVGPAASAARRPAGTGDWEQPGFDAAHTDFNPYEHTLTRANVGQLTASWNLDVGANGPMAAVGSRVFVQTTTAVNAYDVQTGGVVWSHALPSSSFEGTVTVVNGVVYTLATQSGVSTSVLYALAIDDGAQLWKLRIPKFYGGTLTASDGLLYASTGYGTINVIDTATHAIVQKLHGKFSMSTATVADGRVFSASGDGNLYAYDATTGKRDWRVALDNILYPTPSVSDGVVIEAATHDALYALDETTGATLWSFSTGTKFVGGNAVANGTVYFGDYSGKFYAMDLHTGAQHWSLQLGPQPVDEVVVAHGVLYVMTADKTLHVLDSRNGTSLFTTSTGTRPANLVVAHGNVFVSGLLGHLRRWVLPD